MAAPGLDIGTGIAVAFPRSPMVTAGVAWELAEATEGRFRLGLGTQVKAHITRRYSSEFASPGPRLKDYVLAVRAIFRAFQGEERLDYQGEFYKHTLMPAMWSAGKIVHPDVPIDVSAVGPWMLAMAGEVADGIHVHPFHSSKYLDDVLAPRVHTGAERVGRDGSDVDLLIPIFTIVGDTEAERATWRAAAKQQISFYGSTANYSHMFDLHGFDGTSAKLNKLLKAGDLAGMSGTITDEMLEVYAIESTWDELSDRIIDRYGATASRIIFYFAQGMWQNDKEAFAKLGDVARSVRSST
jgi:probable F420-dependent oxidoreductase